MAHLYHPATYDRTLPVGSYWETTVQSSTVWLPLQQSETCEVAIIGAGFTGLSAALHLARDYGIQAHVLEAGVPAWGCIWTKWRLLWGWSNSTRS